MLQNRVFRVFSMLKYSKVKLWSSWNKTETLDPYNIARSKYLQTEIASRLVYTNLQQVCSSNISTLSINNQHKIFNQLCCPNYGCMLNYYLFSSCCVTRYVMYIR